ncbi:MAG: DUF4831 family protein [Lentimicrobiaceae bacterium]|jgi:hypothetical protein|nr:DUF4831 family protein [Lentimicrobiaceae bacterium]
MKKNYIFILMFLITSFAALNIQAQYVTTHSKITNIGQADGIYYALPRNVLRFDFILAEKNQQKGPYAEYAQFLLGVKNYIDVDAVAYELLDVVMTVEAEADPDAVFFVACDAKMPFAFNLQNDGVILSAGKVTETDHANDSQSFEKDVFDRINSIQNALLEKENTLGIFETAFSNRNTEQKAQEAAKFIETIRESRIKLLSGYQEINYGEAMAYMNEQLRQLETEYLSLFLGKETTKIVTQTVYFVPNHDNLSAVFAKYSDATGIVGIESRSGYAIAIRVVPQNNTANINLPSSSAVETTKYNNKLFYRTPDYAQVKVTMKDKTLVNEKVLISQLGALSLVPIDTNTTLIFNTKSGQIIDFHNTTNKKRKFN